MDRRPSFSRPVGFTQVNGFEAKGHDATTKILRETSGKITITLYRIQEEDEGGADPANPRAGGGRPLDAADDAPPEGS